MIDGNNIVDELHRLEEKSKIVSLQNPINIYLIGGGNLALRGIKEATKDIDIIVKSKMQYELLTDVLETHIPGKPIYIRSYKSEWDYDLGMSIRYKHPLDEYFIDIFVKRVLNGLYLSEGMIQRAEIIQEFIQHELFKIHLISKEDIFLFKSITSLERTRDTDDLITLIETGLDWSIIIKELEHQFSKNPNPSQLKISIQDRIEKIFEDVGEIKGLNQILQICEGED